MRKLTVVAAGFGWDLAERNGMTAVAGLRFEPKPSVFPAVTCVAQATLRTGLPPERHGIVSNGRWLDDLRKPVFWEQSSRLVKGERVWGKSTGIFFFQQSLGEDVELILSPAPIHKHGGGMVMACYTKPTGMDGTLRKLCGGFPLWRYWGPLASPRIGRKCIDYFAEMTNVHDVDEAYLYLPTLDYAAQKYGPLSAESRFAAREFRRQLERLSDIAMGRGCTLEVMGDYAITEVSEPPVRPNVVLRRSGLFATRTVGGRSYPDFYQSKAFAMCDHEFCILYGEETEKAAELLLQTGEYAKPEQTVPGSLILLARQGSWCEYKWWTDDREAPDFASHVDIHNKPGFDPSELFFFGRGTVKGTHGRNCKIAHAFAK